MTNYRISVLLPYELDRTPGQRFRWEQWLPHLVADGLTVELLTFSTPSIGAARRRGAPLLAAILFAMRYPIWLVGVLRAARRSDLVIVFRNAALSGPPVAEAILSMTGPPIVYDLDDAIYLPPEDGGNFWRRLARCDWRVGYIARRAVMVGAGCPVLRDHMARFNRNAVLWPTTEDTDKMRLRDHPDNAAPPVIGWTGSPSTALYVEAILPELAALQREVPFTMLVIGAEVDLARHGIEGRCVPWTAATETTLVRQIDIGLMPLFDSPWARGKCALKAIQYQAAGSPAVVSDVGVNREVVLDGETGFVVAPGGDWAPPLRKLLADPDLRRRMGLAGRARVEAHYSAAVVGARVARDLRALLEARAGEANG